MCSFVRLCLFTLLMLGSGVPSGGLLKPTGSSSSPDCCEEGLSGLRGVSGDSGAGWSFTSGFLGVGSRAVGDKARLACGGEKKRILKPGHCNPFGTLCSKDKQHTEFIEQHFLNVLRS